MPKKYALFIGRWQTPYLHEGHKWLINNKLKSGIPVLLAIRDVEQDEKNPYSAKQVEQMIHLQLAEFVEAGLVKTIIIPDIIGVYYGREVGYEVQELEAPKEIQAISATKIREDFYKEQAKRQDASAQ